MLNNTEIPPRRRVAQEEEVGAPSSPDSTGVPPVLDTPLERKQTLGRSVKEVQDILAERAGVKEERDSLQFFDQKHKNAYKNYLKAEAEFKKIKKPTKAQEDEFKFVREVRDSSDAQYIKRQLAYAEKLQGSVGDRVQERTDRWEGIEEGRTEAVLKRYNKMVRMREVVLPKQQLEQEARLEFLDERGKGIFRKGLEWYQKTNQKMESKVKEGLRNTRFGKGITDAELSRRARFVSRGLRVAAFSTIGTGVAMTAGAGAVGGAVGVVGWRALNFLTGAGAGAAWGKVFAETKGARRAEHYDALQLETIGSEEDLKAQAEAHALGSAEAVEAGRTKRENIGALLTSLSFAAESLASHVSLESIKNIPSTIGSWVIGEAHAAPMREIPDTVRGGAGPETVTPKAPAQEAQGASGVRDITDTVRGGSAEAPASSPSIGEASKPEGFITGASIHGKGQGTDQLFTELKERIGQNDVFKNEPSAVVKRVLEASVNDLSHGVGAAAYGEHGMTTQLGDQFFFDEYQNLYYKPENGEVQLYMKNDSTAPGGVRVFELNTQDAVPTSGTETDKIVPPQDASVSGSTQEARGAVPAGTRDIPETIRSGVNEPAIPPAGGTREIPDTIRTGSGSEGATVPAGARDIPETVRGSGTAEVSTEVVRVKAGAEGPAPKGEILKAIVDAKGEGTDSLFLDLKKHIDGNETLSKSESPVLEYLKSHHQNEISRLMSTEVYGVKGMLTHAGDQFFLDENQNLFYQPAGGKPQIFLENKGGKMSVHELKAQTIRAEQVVVKQPTAPEVRQPIPAQEAEGAKETKVPHAAPPPPVQPVNTAPGAQVEGAAQTSGGGTSKNDFVRLDDYKPGDKSITPPGNNQETVTPQPPAATGGGRNDFMQLKDFDPEAALQKSGWTPGAPLPTEKAVFNFQQPITGQTALFFNVKSPNMIIQVAKEHGIDLRGKTVLFDHSKKHLFSADEQRIGAVQFDNSGQQIAKLIDQIQAPNGKPMGSMDTRFLTDRIA